MNDPKQAPEALALRARPKPVTRLSRRALAVLLGGSAFVILGGTMWALRAPDRAAKDGSELYSTDRKPSADGLAALPRDYAGVKPVVAPVLGPPLPGDLGPAILRAEEAGKIPPGEAGMPTPAQTPAEAEAERRRKAAQEAIASPLLVKIDGPATPAALIAPGPAGEAGLSPPASAEPGQTRREALLSRGGDRDVVSGHRLQAPASPWTVLAGTMIPAALVTGLNSDLPGMVVATVTAPVFDSLTGRTLLIPQGARLIGTYDDQVGFGEERALVVWTRLILPNGRSLVLDRLPAGDAQGFAGLADQIDHHWRRLAAGAALSTLLGAGAELAAPQQTGSQGTVIVAARDSLQGSVNQVGQELTRRNLDVKPTIKVRPGHPLRVMVSRDLVLEPYR